MSAMRRIEICEFIIAIFLFVSLCCLAGCGAKPGGESRKRMEAGSESESQGTVYNQARDRRGPAEQDRYSLTLIESDKYRLAEGYEYQTKVSPGSGARFVLYPKEGYVITGTDYEGGKVVRGPAGSRILILPSVQYPVRVRVNCQLDENVRIFLYDANGGTYLEGDSPYRVCYSLNGHLYPNTEIGTDKMVKDRCTLMGWNTQSDGQGVYVGLGSRAAVTRLMAEPEDAKVSGENDGAASRCHAFVSSGDETTLYAVWSEWSREDLFYWKEEGDGITIVSYLGEEQDVTVPAVLDGRPVKKIAARAFVSKHIRRLSLPLELETVEERAFSGCVIEELYFFDRVLHFPDAAFSGTALPRVFLNAAGPPRYAAFTPLSCYADKVDLLIRDEHKKKIVVFGGSGTFYSVLAGKMQEYLQDNADGDERNSEAPANTENLLDDAEEQALDAYTVINMGLNGWFPVQPQLSVIREYLHEGDVLVHIPEMSSAPQLFSETRFAVNEDEMQGSPDGFRVPRGDGAYDDRFMRCLELNYGLISLMDLNESEGFFDSFSRFNRERQDKRVSKYSDNRPYMNAYGDYRGRKKVYGFNQEITGEGDIRPELLTADALRRMDQAYRTFRDKGVCVAVAYAAVNEDALFVKGDYEGNAALFDETLRGGIQNARVIEDIQDAFYQGRYFFDTDWHLADGTDAENTAVITKELQAYMKEEGLIE
ncbi:MAG: hypothetical protein IJ773_11910 [Lachnospiraceae bacterium]|nr:hypothetical protein [Lachnospiraceae bacterium]